jgi:hypothetical protein
LTNGDLAFCSQRTRHLASSPFRKRTVRTTIGARSLIAHELSHSWRKPLQEVFVGLGDRFAYATQRLNADMVSARIAVGLETRADCRVFAPGDDGIHEAVGPRHFAYPTPDPIRVELACSACPAWYTPPHPTPAQFNELVTNPP